MAFGHPWHLDAGMGAWPGIPVGSTLGIKVTHHNHGGNRGAPARPGSWAQCWTQHLGCRLVAMAGSRGQEPTSIPSLLGNFS